jgi:uncharacterized protein YkwD
MRCGSFNSGKTVLHTRLLSVGRALGTWCLLITLVLTPSSSASGSRNLAFVAPQPLHAGLADEYTTWMPLIYNQSPPIPYKPVLSSTPVAPDGSYTLSWAESPTRLADSYTLQEATDAAFTSGVHDICTTTNLTCSTKQSMVGSRYYRVQGFNNWGYGAWSDILTVVASLRGGALVNTQDRQAVLDFYLNDYVASVSPPSGWTGNQTTCTPGSTSEAFRAAVLLRLNYFRAMAGVPGDITFSTDFNRLAQAAAFMMSVNKQLSHTPPNSWTCYSDDGKQGAGKSNLALGTFGSEAITGFMFDFGAGNSPVGHRRWILYPQTQVMGTGNIPPTANYPSSAALLVLDTHFNDARPLTRDGFVAWPPQGYVPYQVVVARWSFSYAGADFTSATITMVSKGASVAVSQAPVVNGYGENTLVWIPLGLNDGQSWPAPVSDTAYTVTIHNVIIGGQSRDFSYTVTVINPGATTTQGIKELYTLASLLQTLP